MMDEFGKFKEIHWSNGQITRYEDIGYGTGSVFNLGNGTVTGNLAVTGIISGDGSAITGVIADGLSGPNIAGTNTIRLETITPGKDIVFATAQGTGSVKIDNGTTSVAIAMESITCSGSATSVTGTAWGTLTTWTLGANTLGANGICTIDVRASKDNAIYSSNCRVIVSDSNGNSYTAATTTYVATANVITRGTFAIWNNGSTTSNTIQPYLIDGGFTTAYESMSMVTTGTLTISLQASNTASSTSTVSLKHSVLRSVYHD